MHKHLDDVQVDGQGSKDVLFRRDGKLVVASQHQLSVVNQVEREHQRAQGRVHQTDDSSRVDHGQEAEQSQNNETDEHDTTVSCKIPFGLESENGQP